MHVCMCVWARLHEDNAAIIKCTHTHTHTHLHGLSTTFSRLSSRPRPVKTCVYYLTYNVYVCGLGVCTTGCEASEWLISHTHTHRKQLGERKCNERTTIWLFKCVYDKWSLSSAVYYMRRGGKGRCRQMTYTLSAVIQSKSFHLWQITIQTFHHRSARVLSFSCFFIDKIAT